MINHPDHYLKESGFEVIDVIEAWNLDFSLGNAVKYIARAGLKDPEKNNIFTGEFWTGKSALKFKIRDNI